MKMKRHIVSRGLAIFISVCLSIQSIPVNGFAADLGDYTGVISSNDVEGKPVPVPQVQTEAAPEDTGVLPDAPVPGELRLVRQIFDCYLKTHSLTGTEAALLAQGARTRNGRPFSRWALRGILTNPVYLRADDAARDYLHGIGAALCARKKEAVSLKTAS